MRVVKVTSGRLTYDESKKVDTSYGHALIEEISQRLAEAIPDGFYVVLDNKLEVDLEILNFHRDHFLRSATHQPVGNSQEASARNLARFKRWLTALGYELSEVTTELLQRYLAFLQSFVSPRTHRKLAPNSINSMMSSVTSFVSWAAAVGIIPSDPNKLHPLNGLNTFQISSGRSRQKSLVRVRQAQSVVNVIPMDALREILAIHGAALPGDPDFGSKISVRALGTLIAFDTGLRVSEVAQFTVSQLDRLGRLAYRNEAATRIPIKVTATKGLKPRTVYFSKWLVRELEHYRDGERAEVAAEAKRRNGGSASIKSEANRGFDEALLLSNGYSNTFSRPLKSDHIRRFFSQAVSEALALPSSKVLTRHSFHELRHTYALCEWHRQLANGFTESRAYAFLQQVLGHSHLSTTQDIYMNAPGFLDTTINELIRKFLLTEYGHNA